MILHVTAVYMHKAVARYSGPLDSITYHKCNLLLVSLHMTSCLWWNKWNRWSHLKKCSVIVKDTQSLCNSVCVFFRSGVWLFDAEAPVYVWQHHQSSRARWPHPEYLVPAAGNRPQGTLWGEDTVVWPKETRSWIDTSMAVTISNFHCIIIVTTRIYNIYREKNYIGQIQLFFLLCLLFGNGIALKI